MKVYTYAPPKLKASAKRIIVRDETGAMACSFQRVYANKVVQAGNYLFDIDWSAQVDAYSPDGRLLFQCRKTTPWLGRPRFAVHRCDSLDSYPVTFTSWQKLAPSFEIIYDGQRFFIKKELLDRAAFMLGNQVLARWSFKPIDGFKARLEIEAECPIQEPEFFVVLFHCLFHIGN